MLSPLIPPGSIVLDMGTGSGVGAVFAARNAARVVAVDVNPEAVRCARINVLLHHIEDRVDAVSYTHLDVYKRQEISFCIQSIMSCAPDSTPIITRRRPDRTHSAMVSSPKRSPWSARMVAVQVKD